MVTSVVDIWNMAVSAAGGRGLISAEDETSRQADLCRLWYATVRDNVLKAASWPSANKWKSLAQLQERDFGDDWVEGNPAPTWKYAYSAPSDMIAPRHLANYGRFDRGVVGTTNCIFTQHTPAVLHYTFRQEDVTKWDSGLVNAVVWALAANLAMPLSGKVTRADRLWEQANDAVLLAATDIANEADDVEESHAPWVAARGYEELPSQQRFVWPYEELNGLQV